MPRVRRPGCSGSASTASAARRGDDLMQKIDFIKELKHLYNPLAKGPARVDVPTMNYLMIDGEGDPNTAPAFAAGVEALFSLSYTLKFMVKKGSLGIDYGVLP